MARYEARRRMIGGRPWWCVWDCVRGDWCALACFGRYRTRHQCEKHIAYTVRFHPFFSGAR